MHPDLFGGETRMYVPLDELTDEEIVALPRAAFDESEWDDLDGDFQKAIYENNEADKERAEVIAKLLRQRALWAREVDSFDEGSEMEIFEQWLNDRVYSNDLLAQLSGDDADEIHEEWIGEGYSEEQVQAAIKEVIEDQTNWEAEFKDSRTGDYWHDLYGSIYMEGHDFAEFDDLAPFYESDVEAAMGMLKNGNYEERDAYDIFEYHKDSLWDVLNPNGPKYATVDINEIETGMTFNVDPNWEMIRDEVKNKLEDEEPVGGEVVVPDRGEERRLMELPDGFYVADLYPTDLPDEGKKQGICVGQTQYGYGRAVATGKTKILSLRRPSGKPLFTFEVSLDPNGNPEEIEQIKGKGNRLPGWDRGGTNQGKVKEHEVKLVKAVVEQLGIDPNDVSDLRPGLQALFPRANPRSSHRPKKTFSDPAGRSAEENPTAARARRAHERKGPQEAAALKAITKALLDYQRHYARATPRERSAALRASILEVPNRVRIIPYWGTDDTKGHKNWIKGGKLGSVGVIFYAPARRVPKNTKVAAAEYDWMLGGFNTIDSGYPALWFLNIATPAQAMKAIKEMKLP